MDVDYLEFAHIIAVPDNGTTSGGTYAFSVVLNEGDGTTSNTVAIIFGVIGGCCGCVCLVIFIICLIICIRRCVVQQQLNEARARH